LGVAEDWGERAQVLDHQEPLPGLQDDLPICRKDELDPRVGFG
jgi:hypothetical protein